MSVLPSGLAEAVADSERVGRFVISSKWVSVTKGRIKYPAFLPAPDDDTSVFRLGSDGVEVLWPIGDAELNGRAYHGAALVAATVIRRNHLDVIASEPPPRHANVRGWPLIPDDPELQKSERNKLALSIAEEARFAPRPQSS